jgi:hypothetical protein
MPKLRKTMSYVLLMAIAGVFCTELAYSIEETPPSKMYPVSTDMRVLTESDFHCGPNYVGRYYDIVWDGWRGRLELYPDGTGKLIGSGFESAVRHTVARNPQEEIEGLRGPGFADGDPPSQLNHRLVFWVDFDLPGESFTQRFDGYMRTASPSFPYNQHTIAGITWWRGLPFAFRSSRAVEFLSTARGVEAVVPDTCFPADRLRSP